MTMRILYIIGQDAGGLPHYAAELANSVAEYADVTVMKPRETSADELFSPDVEVIDAFSSLSISMPRLYRRDINPRDVVRGIRSYDQLKQIRRLDVDLVHDTTDLFPHVKFFLKRHGIDKEKPVVITRHEVEANRFSFARPAHLAEELVHTMIPDLRLSRTIVHTENQKRALMNRGVPATAIEVIPHGTYSVFGDHSDLVGDGEPNTLLFFGNVIPYKGIETLVRAIPLVKREIPDVKLLIAGDGQIPSSVESILDAHPENFEIHNRFIPNHEVKQFFGRATVVVLPYHEREGKTNGHSGVLSTALSFGKPVVASTAGDFPSLVEGRGCGMVVPSRDPERLAAAIVRLLQDDDARAEMARNSEQLGDELSWDLIARRHIDVYESILGDGAEPGVSNEDGDGAGTEAMNGRSPPSSRKWQVRY